MSKPPVEMEVKTRIKLRNLILPQTDHDQLNLFPSPDQAENITSHPCPRCGSNKAIQTSGVGPHYAALRCGSCDRFLKWLPNPRTEGTMSAPGGGTE